MLQRSVSTLVLDSPGVSARPVFIKGSLQGMPHLEHPSAQGGVIGFSFFLFFFF